MLMDTDVLIVGAGPTGLMLANQLARHGVRALIIDRHAGPALQTRALGVQARTLEIYSHLGIVVVPWSSKSRDRCEPVGRRRRTDRVTIAISTRLSIIRSF